MKQENQEESIEIQMFPSRIHLDSKITLHSILRWSSIDVASGSNSFYYRYDRNALIFKGTFKTRSFLLVLVVIENTT